MPLVRIVTNQFTQDTETKTALLAEVSESASRLLKKPERWVMTCLEPGAAMTFAGTEEPACYIEVKNIGKFTPELTSLLSSEISSLVSKHLGIDKARTYVEFSDAVGYLWGYDGSTFG